jgi:hypothetical protein
MALATLSIDLVAKLAELQAGMDKAGRIAAKTADDISGRFAAAGRVAAGLGSTLAGAFAGFSLGAFVKQTIDGLDALNDLSDATGASIENISALEDIAARTGTTMDTVGTALVKLNSVLADAKPGSAQASALKAIGLEAEALRQLDPAEALRRVAVALAGYADDGNKARLVQDLFGKSVKEVAPLLKDLADGGGKAAENIAKQAAEAEKFNKQLAALGKNATDAAREISGPLVSSLNAYFAALNSDKGVVGTYFDTVQVDYFRARLQATREEMEAMAPAANRAASVLKGQPDSLRAKATLADYAALQKAADEYQAKIDAILYGGGKRRPANEGGGRFNLPSVGDVPGATAKETAAPKAFVSNSFDQATVQAIKALESTDAARITDLNNALAGLYELQRETRGDPAVVAAIAKVREELDKLDPAVRDATEAKKRLDAILAQTPQGVLADVLTDVQLLNAAFADGKIDADTWAAAVRNATGKLPKAAEEPLAQISEFAQQAGRNIQDALGDTVLATLEGDFDSIEKLWGNMLKRMAAQAIAAQIGQALLGDNFSKTGQVGGAAGELFKWLQALGQSDGGHAAGMRFVPYDGYRATLHRGERVQSAAEVRSQESRGGAAGATFQTIVQGDASPNTLRLIRNAQAQFEARLMRQGA